MNESNTKNTAQLGCGTLIIIALIVMFFSGGRESQGLRNNVNELNIKVDRLEKKIDALITTLTAQQPSPPTAEDTK